jgi:uncharacterized membrane protein YeaQ/YmgE (transglycosylase-associated protein family)
MGLYVWIAIGFVVAVIARLIVRTQVVSGWLEPALMGIAGGVVGGWIGARIWSDGGINSVGTPELVGAAIGGAVLATIYLSSHRRRTVQAPKTIKADESPRRAA